MSEYLSHWSDAELHSSLRYGLAAPTATTWGPCAAGCGGVGRGAGLCIDCLTRELDRRKALADTTAEGGEK